MKPIEQLEQLLTNAGYRPRRFKFETGYFLSVSDPHRFSITGPWGRERRDELINTVRGFFPLALPWSDFADLTATVIPNLAAEIFDSHLVRAFYLYDSSPARRSAMKARLQSR